MLQLASLPDNVFLITWENTCGLPSGNTRDGIIQTASSQAPTPDLMLREETKRECAKDIGSLVPWGEWDLEKLLFSLYLSVFFPQF